MNSDRDSHLRILLVRFGAMGDIIHSLPAAAVLRKNFPNARIDWVVEDRWSPLLQPEGKGILDEVLRIDTFKIRRNPLAVESWKVVRSFTRQLRRTNYDVAVDLQGAIKSALVCRLSGAAKVIGLAAPWVREKLASYFYSLRVKSHATHVVEANLDLVKALFTSASGSYTPEFTLPAGDERALPANIPKAGFAVVNPGAGWRSKQWPVEAFGKLCDLLAHRGMATVINCGPQEDNLCQQLQSSCRIADPIVFSGDIPQLIALLRRASLMVGPDTGPLHLAAAMGVPTLGIYGPTDPARNGPYGAAVRSLRADGARTFHRRSAAPDGSMHSISPERVMQEIEFLLAKPPRLQEVSSQ